MTLSLPTFTGGLEVTATQLQQLSDALAGFNNPWRAKAYQTSAVTNMLNITGTLILFDAEEYDVTGWHSTVSQTSRLTVPSGADGFYLIMGSIGFAVDADGYRDAAILVNGTAVGRSHVQSPPTVNAAVQVHTVRSLVATDYVELQGQHSAGAAIDTVLGSAYTWLAVQRLHD